MIDWDKISDYIYTRDDGALVYQSIFQKTIDRLAWERLLNCIEDNIDFDTDVIDWEKARKDFEKGNEP